MKKTLGCIKIHWSISVSCIIIILFSSYIDSQIYNREYLSVVIYENNNKRVISSNYDIKCAHFVNKFEYFIAIKPDNDKSIAWLHTYNGPVKLKCDKTNKFFVISKAPKVSFWGSLGNEINYTWFKLWH